MTALAPEYIEDDLLDDIDDLDDEDIDDLDDDLGDDLGERRFRLRRRRRGARVRGRSYSRPRQGRYVSQTQLQAAMARIGGDVRKLAAHGKTVERRLDRAYAKLRTDMQRSQQMAMLLPLLNKPKTVEATLTTSSGSKTHDVMVETDDTMSLMLPFLLMGQSGDGGFGDNNSMMMLALVMAMDKKD